MRRKGCGCLNSHLWKMYIYGKKNEKYEISVQLQYEQYYAEIEGKLPIFELFFSVILEIVSDFGEM